MNWNSETEKLCPKKNLQRTEQILEHPIINEYSGFHINHIQMKTDSSSHSIKGKKIKATCRRVKQSSCIFLGSSISLQNSCLNYSNQKAKADSSDLKSYLDIVIKANSKSLLQCILHICICIHSEVSWNCWISPQLLSFAYIFLPAWNILYFEKIYSLRISLTITFLGKPQDPISCSSNELCIPITLLCNILLLSFFLTSLLLPNKGHVLFI